MNQSIKLQYDWSDRLAAYLNYTKGDYKESEEIEDRYDGNYNDRVSVEQDSKEIGISVYPHGKKNSGANLGLGLSYFNYDISEEYQREEITNASADIVRPFIKAGWTFGWYPVIIEGSWQLYTNNKDGFTYSSIGLYIGTPIY